MTERDVDAAVGLIRGLRFYRDGGPDIPDCVPMRPLLMAQPNDGLTLGHLRLLCTALAEARQQLAKLTAELDGDGTRSADPVKSLGLRACMKLHNEHNALLRRRIANYDAMEKKCVKAPLHE